MSDISFISLPFQPMSSMRTPFYFSTAIMGEYLANLFNGKYYLGINELHSFKSYSDNECEAFIRKFDFIERKSLYLDVDYIDRVKSIIVELYNAGEIQVKKELIAVCDCGRVEIAKTEIDRFHGIKRDMQLVQQKGDDLFCRVCQQKLSFEQKNSLYLRIREEELNEKMLIHPDYLNLDMNHFRKSLHNGFLRISRERNTGVELLIDGIKFNLDIDMLWKFIPFCIDSSKVVVVSSVKHMFSLINYLSKILKKCVYFIGLPFIQTSDISDGIMDFYRDENHRNSLKLLVDLGVGWSKKNIILQESMCKYFMSSKEKNNNLIKHIYSNQIEEECNWEDMCKYIVANTSLQKVQSEIKRKKFDKDKLYGSD